MYNFLNSRLNNLKSGIKNETEIVLRLSSNILCNFDDVANFPLDLLLTDRKVANLCKTLTKYTTVNIKLSKTLKLSKMIQSEEFLGKPLAPLLKIALPLTKKWLNH